MGDTIQVPPTKALKALANVQLKDDDVSDADVGCVATGQNEDDHSLLKKNHQRAAGNSAHVIAPLEVKILGSSLIVDSSSSLSISKTLGSEDSDDREVENKAVTSQKSVGNNTQECADQVFDGMSKPIPASGIASRVHENNISPNVVGDNLTPAGLITNGTWGLREVILTAQCPCKVGPAR